MTIDNFLQNLKNICDYTKEKEDFYITSNKKENLKKISEELNKKFECKTFFVPQCYIPCATPCDDWIPSETQEWCLQKCSNEILRVETNKNNNNDKKNKEVILNVNLSVLWKLGSRHG